VNFQLEIALRLIDSPAQVAISANGSQYTVPWQSRSTKNAAKATIWTISNFPGRLMTQTLNIPNAVPGHIHFHRDSLTDRVDIYLLHLKGVWEECTERWAIARLHDPITHPEAHTIILDTYGEDKWSPGYISKKTYDKRKHAYGGLKRYNEGIHVATV